MRYIFLVLLLSGCAIKPAPLCIFCDQDLNGETHTEKHHVPAAEPAATK